MIKVVIDSIVVSGTLVDKGPSTGILDLTTASKLDPDPGRVSAVLDLLGRTSTEVFPNRTLRISQDETDNRFLECAEGAAADFLVTGNIRHFPASGGTPRS